MREELDGAVDDFGATASNRRALRASVAALHTVAADALPQEVTLSSLLAVYHPDLPLDDTHKRLIRSLKADLDLPST